MNSQFATGYDLNDLLFQNRNRAYGAFPLRKQYHQRLISAMLSVFGFVVIWACWVLYKDVPSVDQPIKAPYQTVLYQLKNPTLPTPKPPTPAVAIAKVKSSGQSISSKIEITSQPQPSTKLRFSGGGDEGPRDGGGESGSTQGGSGTDSTQIGSSTNTTISTNQAPVVDVAPSFPGGVAALRQFLERNLVNPRDMESGEEVTVLVHFIVGYDGALKDINTDDEVESIFMKEIRRVFARMPNWEPGRASGQKVKVQYQMPIKFIAGP